MTTESSSEFEGVSRRKFIVASGAASVAGIAGCAGNNQSSESESTSGKEGQTGTAATGGSAADTSALRADGSSTVYPITNKASGFWNSNPPASDEEYWGPGEYDIDTEKPLADYWAGLYGFEAGNEGRPPFSVSVGLSHSGVGLEKVSKGQVDIGDASASVEDEMSDASEEELKKFKNHVVGVDAQPVVVSKAIYDAGVTKLNLDQLKKIYKGKITNWSEVGGPDKDIQVIGRAVGSGTDTSFRANVFGDPNAEIPGVDVRKGENQQVKTVVSNTDNAIAYLALAFVDEEAVPPVALEIDGTTYTYGDNLGAKEYPLSRDLHCYTYEGTSKKEAAFINMILSDFGQEKFVASNNYVTLPEDRRKEEQSKLPSQE